MESKGIPGRDGIGIGKKGCGHETRSRAVWLMPRTPIPDQNFLLYVSLLLRERGERATDFLLGIHLLANASPWSMRSVSSDNKRSPNCNWIPKSDSSYFSPVVFENVFE